MELIAARDAYIELVAADGNKIAVAGENVGLLGALMATNNSPGAHRRQQCRGCAADEGRR
jgi:hypothetical protein